MLKFSILCVVLACAIQWSVALPSPWAAEMPQLPSSGTSDRNQNLKLRESFTTMVSGVLNFTSTLKSAVFDRLTLDVGKTLFGMALRMEFQTIAVGKNLAFSSKMNKSQHKMAAFFVNNCWTRLDRMEEADKILDDATQNAAESMMRESLHGTGKPTSGEKFLEQMFDQLEAYIKSNPKLEDEFERFEVEQDEKNYKVYFTANDRHGSEEKAREWLSDPKIQNSLINRLFLTNSQATFTALFKGTDYEHLLIVKAILAVARQAETRKIAQKLYDEAVLETVEEFDPDLYPTGLANFLFEKLQTKFESASELRDKFLLAKKNVSNDEISLEKLFALKPWLPF